MITNKNKIAISFSHLHDGSIIFEKEENTNQVWKIDCEYLAEMINPQFTFFWIKIFDCKSLEFKPWLNPTELKQPIWKTTNEIFKAELEILSVEEKDNQIKIHCNQYDEEFNFSAGELFLDCQGIKVFDEEWNEISFEELDKVCERYWKKFETKNKKLIYESNHTNTDA